MYCTESQDDAAKEQTVRDDHAGQPAVAAVDAVDTVGDVGECAVVDAVGIAVCAAVAAVDVDVEAVAVASLVCAAV